MAAIAPVTMLFVRCAGGVSHHPDESVSEADVAVGVMSATLVHMANASYRVGRKLAFDEKTLSFPNDKDATALLTRKYRAPYIVPEKV